MVAILPGANVQINDTTVSVKGSKGQVTRNFKVRGLKLEQKNREIVVGSDGTMQIGPAIIGTVEGHIKNMMKGVTEGYTRKMKVVYSHFPITIEVKGDEMNVKNFLGEKQNRIVKVIGATKIAVSGQDLTITGPSIEDVGQTISNIRTATKIRNRDCRVFQDGIYPVEE